MKYQRLLVKSGRDEERLGLSVAQPLTDALTLEAGVGFRNSVTRGGAYDYSLGVSYDLGNNTTASAMISGAQRSKLGADADLGTARLIVGISKSF